MSKKWGLAIILLLGIGGIILVFLHPTKKRPGLDSVVNLGIGLARDVDTIGQTLARVSDEEEIKVGQEIVQEILSHYRIITNTPRARYLQAVGQTLTPQVNRKKITYQFYIVQYDDINAFAVAGGHIFITSGMLQFLRTESELVLILGHEIGHIDLRHCIELVQYELFLKKIGLDDLKMVARIGYELIRRGFSEKQELEADKYGLEMVIKTQYHPKAALNIFGRMSDIFPEPEKSKPDTVIDEITQILKDALEDYIATHPALEKRLDILGEMVAQRKADWQGRTFYIGRANYEQTLARETTKYPKEWEEVK